MKTINLDNLHGISDDILKELKNHDSLFLAYWSLDNLMEKELIINLARRINEYCLKNNVVGYHYTRAIHNDIKKSGLCCRDGETIRSSFLEKYQHLFSDKEIQIIKKNWSTHFNLLQQKIRDNRLYFNFTTSALRNSGADPLLSNFGGEQVYMPLKDIKGIGNKLKTIGKPLILKCKLDPNKIKTFHEYPWGRIAISTYHTKINKLATRFDQDGYQFENVLPKDIIIIEH